VDPDPVDPDPADSDPVDPDPDSDPEHCCRYQQRYGTGTHITRTGIYMRILT
jgi:hypothetical protein